MSSFYTSTTGLGTNDVEDEGDEELHIELLVENEDSNRNQGSPAIPTQSTPSNSQRPREIANDRDDLTASHPLLGTRSSASLKDPKKQENDSTNDTWASNKETHHSQGYMSMGSLSRHHHQTKTRLHVDEESISLLYPSPQEETYGYWGKGASNHDHDFTIPNDTLMNDQMSLIDPYFDMTRERLCMIFDEIDVDHCGKVSSEQFRQALENLGIRCADDAAFAKLVDTVDKDNTKFITCPQFESAVQKLKLADLFQPSTVYGITGEVEYQSKKADIVEYSPKRIRRFSPSNEEELRLFFTSDLPSWVSVRWINIQGHDELYLKRLSIKYRLHPLAIEDTLELHERPKFDRYDNHIFIVFPVLRMQRGAVGKSGRNAFRINSKSFAETPVNKSTSQPSFDGYLDDMQKPGRVRANSFANLNRVRHISKRSDRKKSLSESFTDDVTLDVEHIAIFLVGNNTLITIKEGYWNTWEAVNHRLSSPYSKLRHNDATFLLYAVLDVIVDEVVNVMDAVTMRLVELEVELEQQKHNFQLNKLRTVKNELFKLPRLLKPAREVLKNMIDSQDINEVTTAYIRDVHDHVVQVLDDIELQLQMSRLLTEEYRETVSNKINYVVYLLTIVTSIFLPAQFLTGVYGMNFDVMPELHWEYGYLYFWVEIVLIAIGLQVYFRHKKWILSSKL